MVHAGTPHLPALSQVTFIISWFVAEGGLVQFDEHFDRLEQSQIRHRMRGEVKFGSLTNISP
jgi:hypothetical protein